MFLSREEKIVVHLLRIEKERVYTLFGKYKDYRTGEKRIRKLRNKIEKLGGDPDLKLSAS